MTEPQAMIRTVPRQRQADVSFLDAYFGSIERLILIGISVCLLLQTYLIFKAEVNWDEFAYLAKIYEHQSGTLNRALQTAHVYPFAWLPLTSTSEVVQIEYARIVMLSLQAGTFYCIYRLASNFVSQRSALFAVLLFGCAGATLLHGSSFRADPIAAFLMMFSLCLLSSSTLRFWHYAVSILAIAFAGMITVKSVFYLPAFVTIGFWQVFRSQHYIPTLARFAGVAIGSTILFCVLYLWHQSSLPFADIDGSRKMMSSAAKTTLLKVDFFPRIGDVFSEFSRAFISAGILISGTIFALFRVRFSSQSKELILLGLALPVLSLLFYGNAYPYFLPFIFPPAMIIAGYSLDHLNLSTKSIRILIFAIILSATWTTYLRSYHNQESQEETVKAVHSIFPEPVSYIDRNSMISSFPKQGFFMSRWGLQDYRETGKPIFKYILNQEVVPMLVLNSPTLEEAVGIKTSELPLALFFDEDRKLLALNYVPYWGKIWVAGKKLSIMSEPTKFTIRIPGDYRVNVVAPVNINGRVYNNNQSVFLSRGEHQISGKFVSDALLIWAAAKPPPTNLPTDKPIYRGFQ